MEFYVGMMNIIFVGFCKSIHCQNICGNDGDLLICCSNYHIENGECVSCPYGSFGINCSESCPNGFYGEFCLKVCSCTEKEICDVAYGCVDYSTQGEFDSTMMPKWLMLFMDTENNYISTSLFKEEFRAITNWQITYETALQSTEQTTQQTTGIQNTETKTPPPAVPLYIYLVSVGCTSLIFFTCMLIMYRKMTHLTRNGGGHESVGTSYELVCARQEQSPQSEDPNAEEVMSVHDYIDILDMNSIYLEPCSLTPTKSSS